MRILVFTQHIRRYHNLYRCVLLGILLDIIPSRPETDVSSQPEVSTSLPFVLRSLPFQRQMILF